MAAGSFVKRMLLVFLLSVLDYSSAFPRARSSVYPEAWQGVKEKQKEVYVYGSRRPLHYIRALRQTHREPQPNIHVPVQIKAWQKHPGGSLRVHNHAQIQNLPSLYHQTRSPYQLWSNVATKGTQEMSILQSPLQRNHPLANPRSFEFNLKLPFANFPSQNKDNSSSTKSFDLNSSGSGGAGHESTYKPSGMHVDSSFKSPSDSDSLDKGFTDEGKNDHEVSKPNFQLSLSIPFPPFPKPYSSNDGDLKNSTTIPGSNVQNSNMKPEKTQLSSTQSGSDWILLNSASAVQQQPIHDTYESIRTPVPACPTASDSVPANPTASSSVPANPTASSSVPANLTASSSVTANCTLSSSVVANPTASNSILASPTASSSVTASLTTSSSVPANPTASSSVPANPTASSSIQANLTASSSVTANCTLSSSVMANPTASNSILANPTASSSVPANPTASSSVPANPTASSSVPANPTASSSVPANLTALKLRPGQSHSLKLRPSQLRNILLNSLTMFTEDTTVGK
ncbi:uncharacterized protein PB18E9.04c-like [Plectropomus leopardus]|uniref:uncharacterized protein PB18E9.04c-like n=1 Tax=Plectropomus leopardus TaxID=160734 RepID=UPI001C4BC0BB|nr:uncharacterized protein PB18E9.04c-like [Plectropomus leopardus]